MNKHEAVDHVNSLVATVRTEYHQRRSAAAREANNGKTLLFLVTVYLQRERIMGYILMREMLPR